MFENILQIFLSKVLCTPQQVEQENRPFVKTVSSIEISECNKLLGSRVVFLHFCIYRLHANFKLESL